MKPQYLHDTDPWTLGEDIPNADLFFSRIWLNGFVNSFKQHTGRAYRKVLCRYEGYHLWFYFGGRDSFEVGENIAKRIIHELGYGATINKHIIIEANKLRAFSTKIPQKNLQKLSNNELWRIYERHDKIHGEYYRWCWIPVGADMFHGNLTNKIKNYLKGDLHVPEKLLNKYFVTLTQPTKKSLIFIEQQNLLRIAAVIEKSRGLVSLFKKKEVSAIRQKLPETVLRLIAAHRRKYGYTKHLWVKR